MVPRRLPRASITTSKGYPQLQERAYQVLNRGLAKSSETGLIKSLLDLLGAPLRNGVRRGLLFGTTEDPLQGALPLLVTGITQDEEVILRLATGTFLLEVTVEEVVGERAIMEVEEAAEAEVMGTTLTPTRKTQTILRGGERLKNGSSTAN